jgi:hypothetical protein
MRGRTTHAKNPPRPTSTAVIVASVGHGNLRNTFTAIGQHAATTTLAIADAVATRASSFTLCERAP